MKPLTYLTRLVLQSGKLLGRVFLILVPVAGYSLWRVFGEAAAAHADVAENGPPNILTELDAWDAFTRGKIGAAEMSYYEQDC